MVTLEPLSAILGEAKITIEEGKPEERTKLAETVQKLIHEGNAVFLLVGKDTLRIKDYDPTKNEWVVEVEGRRGRRRKLTTLFQRRVPAGGTKATAIAPSAGG